MPRPRKFRRISNFPDVTFYKPAGVPLFNLKEVNLLLEEFEALKLKDYNNYNDQEAARKLNVSQPTFNRIYNEAKRKLVSAIVEGAAIKIEGGNFILEKKEDNKNNE